MKLIRIFLILLIYTFNLSAQNGGSVSYPDARSVAMGSQFAVTAFGIYAVNSNPANLVISNTKIEVAAILPIPNFSGSTGSDFLTVSDLNYYFGGVRDADGALVGRFLTDADKQNFLAKFDSGNEIRSSAIINLLAVSFYPDKKIGAFSFTINDILGQKTAIPKDVFELGLYGNEIGREYNFDGLVFSSSYLREYDLSYARDFSKLLKNVFSNFTAGITLKYIQGFAYSEIERAQTRVITNEDHSIRVINNMEANFAFSPDLGITYDFENVQRNSDFGAFLQPVGNGWGINIGFSAQLEDVWKFGLSFTDIGVVSWNSGAATYSANGDVLIKDIINSDVIDSLTSVVEPTGSYSSGFTSNLPTALRMGASVRLDKIVRGNFPGELVLALGYNQGFTNGANNTTFPLLSLGAEWKPTEIIPIRSGIVLGGFDGIAWSFGFGIDARFVEFNLATSNITTVFMGNNSKVVHVVFGSRWKIW
ncbi:hypothetical protein MNBD_IGNAVI01-2155 [hydrothermal vent metagenome]|uniref:DUF5723 domain-containing protein n=1 Tax=hydrothermal vent metagenome TaxID=652676 RepID=A0A3B1CM09_9ZZZZ